LRIEYQSFTLRVIASDGTGWEHVSEAVWKKSLYMRRGYVIYRARLRTDLLDNRSLDMLLKIYK